MYYTATNVPYMYSSSGHCAHDLPALQSGFGFFLKCTLRRKSHLCITLQRMSHICIPHLVTARMISQPCNQNLFFSVHCNKNPIYVFLFWELCAWSPCPAIRIRLFLMYTAMKIPSWNQVPRMISSPAIRIFTLQQKTYLCIPLLGIAQAARRGRGTRYPA